MNIQVVIIHFSEPWELVWELHAILMHYLSPLHTLDVVIYHRGGEPYMWTGGTIPYNTKIVHQKNVGREAYVVHHHIYNTYDHISDLVMFIPASWKAGLRLGSLSEMIMRVHTNEFLPSPMEVKWEIEKNFALDSWHGLTDVNRMEVQKQEFSVASIRPFGKWYEQRIPVPYKDLVVLNCIFSVPKKNIHRYPREYYKNWLEELESSGPNTELVHYWERTWYSLFS